MGRSLAVKTANEKLQQLRQKLGVTVQAPSGLPLPFTPDHEVKNGQKQLDLYRQRDGKKCRKPALQSTPVKIDQRERRQAQLNLDGATIKHYPDLGLAALSQTEGAIYRVWLLCRHLDKNGRGWLTIGQLRDALTKKEAKLRIFGWRRLRQILKAGEGKYWHRDGNRLWLHGVARVARHYELVRLGGRPVSLPITAATAKIGTFQAHLYGAWHSGRKTDNPISRAKQRQLLHVPERTQRHYCKVAQIQRTVNYAIGDKHSDENQQEGAWKHGTGSFTFTDKYGYQGGKNKQYIAWQLPSSHLARHSTAPRGRQRKINRQLAVDLVINAAQGNDGERVDKLFFQNGAQAVKAFNRAYEQGGGIDTYWPQSQKRKKRYGLWGCLSDK